ncbi:MAG: GDSL-type esterase/lipase family protein [Oscillospiraceae bacterium]|nr:GDSL-type esterase/lipase family protein [Oscillospiraceae bacterium]
MMKQVGSGPAAAFILLIAFIAVIVKCCSGSSDKTKDPADNSLASNDSGADYSFDLPVTSISELSVETTVSTTSEPVKYQEVDFVPDDVSLVSSEYLSDIVVVGDSIAKGYGVYGRLPVDNVLAVGSVGARNLFTYTYEYQGFSLDLLDILGRKLPKYIFISVGMNDVNILSDEEYAQVYENNIKSILEKTPESKIFVMAVTPVASITQFTSNDKIDKFNEKLRVMVNNMDNDAVYYINAAQYLKNDYNYLISDFSSGDGIHLAASAYDYLLSYMLTAIDWIK